MHGQDRLPPTGHAIWLGLQAHDKQTATPLHADSSAVLQDSRRARGIRDAGLRLPRPDLPKAAIRQLRRLAGHLREVRRFVHLCATGRCHRRRRFASNRKESTRDELAGKLSMVRETDEMHQLKDEFTASRLAAQGGLLTRTHAAAFRIRRLARQTVGNSPCTALSEGGI